ncbi:MAG: dicarboxylate/amino acid:cation symporter [Candidatus Poribacteria bacterium]|nr:dicarboxylate/amino acid:cation symporter [Candidatus Poribacteria bacterium]
MNENGSNGSKPKVSLGLLYGIVIAIVAGAIIGGYAPDFAVHTTILGEIFLNLLKMIVVPLVILSMIVGITNLGDIRNIGSIGGRTVLYYMATTAISVVIGMILVNIISPGKGLSQGEERADLSYILSGPEMLTVEMDGEFNRTYNNKYVITLVDQNVRGEVESISGTSATVKLWQPLSEDARYVTTDSGEHLLFVDGRLETVEPENSGKGINIGLPIATSVSGKMERTMGSTIKEVFLGNEETGKEGMIPSNVFKAMVRTDILPLIFFSLLIGAALSMLGDIGKPVVSVISGLNEAVMKLVHWIMYVAPVGIFGLIAGRIGEAKGFAGFWPELVAVGKYSATVVLGLGIHGAIALPILLLILGRRNPLNYFKGMATALLNAFSTASSSATLPLTMEGVENQNGVSRRTSSFVLPLGATINMDGTALYEAVAVMFIAQVYAINMDPAQQVVVVLTATLAAIGAAGIPEAGLVTMVIVLRAVDLPVEGITLILSIDWLLDRFRTTVNVWGDSIGAGVIETYESRDSTDAPATA